MKKTHAIAVFAALFYFAVSHAADLDISSVEKMKAVAVTTNDVVLIKTPTGQSAVLQFTGFGTETATYRWRYRAGASQPNTSGKGDVRESYDRKPNDQGGFDVTPRADHNAIVRAGDLKIEWSYGGKTKGFLYYYPSRATIQLLTKDAFDKDF